LRKSIFYAIQNEPGSNPVLPEAQPGENREPKKFFIWIRSNPLKSPESAKEIQGNASFFACLIWICLDLFGRQPEPASARLKP
jgi:hypothetical protein